MIDMHMHSKYSDGTCSVEEILKEAEKLKLKYISITDHDNCLAYHELRKINVSEIYLGKIIPGIEIKCAYQGRLIEVLGYNYDIDKMQKWINEYYKDKQRRDIQTKYLKLLYEACQKLNLRLSPIEEIPWNPENDWASVAIYNDFKKYDENKEKLPEDLWEDFTTFTKKYCGDLNSVFYIDKSKDYPTLDIAIDAIKKCGGIAIMAHIFIYKWNKNKEEFIQGIIDKFEIDGFECYYPKFSDEQTKYIVNICKQNNFLTSGGSDWHGDNKPEINMGIGTGNLNVSEEILKTWPILQ